MGKTWKDGFADVSLDALLKQAASTVLLLTPTDFKEAMTLKTKEIYKYRDYRAILGVTTEEPDVLAKLTKVLKLASTTHLEAHVSKSIELAGQ